MAAAKAKAEDQPKEDPKSKADAETKSTKPAKAKSDELIKDEAKDAPEPPKGPDLFVRVLKVANYVNMVQAHDGKKYQEVQLDDVNYIIQEDDMMVFRFKNSSALAEVKVDKDQADKLLSTWRSLKAQRRNA